MERDNEWKRYKRMRVIKRIKQPRRKQRHRRMDQTINQERRLIGGRGKGWERMSKDGKRDLKGERDRSWNEKE